MLREKFVTKRQFEVFSRNLDRKLNSLKIPSFTVPDDNYDPEDVPGSVPTGGVAYQVLYTDSAGNAQWAMPGTRNILIGEKAGKDVTLSGISDSIYIGYLAGGTTAIDPLTGSRNIFIGSIVHSAIEGFTTDNVVIGHDAGNYLADSCGNVIIGSYANYCQSPAQNSICIGTSAIVDGTNCIAIGAGASAASNECRIGNDALLILETIAQFVSLLPDSGTSPLSVLSTTVCTNLNADMLDGFHATDFSGAFTPIVDADFGNTPDTGDADTDDLIDKMRDALISHGLVAVS